MKEIEHATEAQIEETMELAWKAYHIYRKLPLKTRANFMYRIADELELLGDELIEVAMHETNLPAARLKGEKARTVFQLKSYADACERGEWMEVRIDTADKTRNPPKPDIRKMMVPLGPVIVFGASNFPFAYSTAGGDTACALAAGCPVIVKAHGAHAQTGNLVAAAILKAAAACNMPEGIFAHLHGKGSELGKALVMHPHAKAVGFTGSFAGGKALFDMANSRKEPIPVFAEMGSVNPVFLLPEKLKLEAAEVADMYAASITLSVGQFCTNPGLLIAIDSEPLQVFLDRLKEKITGIDPAPMLHPGIFKSYVENRATAIAQEEVEVLAVSEKDIELNEGMPTIASVSGAEFLKNPLLHQEVFGPYSLVIRCKDYTEMLTVAKGMEGQLTSTVMATENDMHYHEDLIEAVKNICGRFIMNGVPTGVEVCLAMQHGGPFPSCTDSRFTSVGADGIKRFTRPIAFQNWPERFLPEELKDSNPAGIWRTINNQPGKQ